MWERQALHGFTWECWEGDGVDWSLTGGDIKKGVGLVCSWAWDGFWWAWILDLDLCNKKGPFGIILSQGPFLQFHQR